jgi:hypothetical protein
MKRWFLSVILCLSLTAAAFADSSKGLKIDLVDNKLSIDADTVPLARLMRLVDSATGMTSRVPPELANRNISVKFSGLSVTDGVRKIFQGQPLDYVVIEGKGVIVTGASQNLNGTEAVAAYPAVPGQQEQPFVQDFQQQQPIVQAVIPGQNGFPAQPGFAQQQQQQQPAYIQTPFGQMPNSRVPQQNQPNLAFSPPGSSIFPNGNTAQQPTALAPMGTPGQVGTSPQNSPSNNPFGAAPNLFPGQIPHQ